MKSYKIRFLFPFISWKLRKKDGFFYSNINGRKILKFQLGNNLINDGEGGKKIVVQNSKLNFSRNFIFKNSIVLFPILPFQANNNIKIPQKALKNTNLFLLRIFMCSPLMLFCCEIIFLMLFFSTSRDCKIFPHFRFFNTLAIFNGS